MRNIHLTQTRHLGATTTTRQKIQEFRSYHCLVAAQCKSCLEASTNLTPAQAHAR
jgi:hypothetical protein